MIVEAAELGTRPTMWTKARSHAPAGVKALGELFAAQDWADKVIILLDWQPEELKGGEQANDALVRVYLFKRTDGLVLTLYQNFDVNNLFSVDLIDKTYLGWITEDFQKKLDFELKRRGAQYH